MSKNDEWAAWLETRPPAVRELARQYPVGHVIIDKDGGPDRYILGYNVDGTSTLVLSQINPFEDYDGAMTHKEYLCVEHITPPVRLN